jgi:hypothetical protein
MKALFFHTLFYACALILFPATGLATQPSSIAVTAVLVTVTPENAPQNTPRTITVKTSGAFFCLPLFGIMNSAAVDDANVLTITFPNFAPGFVFPTPPATAICPAIVASVEQSFQFTPTKAGIIKVKALQSNGPISGQASILTSPKGETRGYADVSGMYYDNNTNGSGLALHHDAQGTTSGLFGAWFAYDAEGKSRWLTIQETRWETTDILVGNLYETKANANQCPLNSPLCIARFSSVQKIGTVRISFFILRPLDDVIRPTEVKAIGLDGATMFSSSVYRLPL